MNDQLDANKRNAQAFYDLMFNQCRPAEAIEQFVGSVYIQHNPAVGDGKQAFIDHVVRMAHQYPGNRGPASTSSAVMTRGKIVEHWDVLQRVPETSANANTMF